MPIQTETSRVKMKIWEGDKTEEREEEPSPVAGDKVGKKGKVNQGVPNELINQLITTNLGPERRYNREGAISSNFIYLSLIQELKKRKSVLMD